MKCSIEWLRLFVRFLDVEHPIVLMSGLVLTDDLNYVVPCKPTSRKATVECETQFITVNKSFFLKLLYTEYYGVSQKS